MHNIEKDMKRPLRYWYDDGLTELAAGFIFVLIGLLFFAEEQMPREVVRGGMSAIGLPLLIIGGSLFVRWIVRIAKERITYPRTGYVSYQRQPQRNKRTAGIVGAAVAIAITILIAIAPGIVGWIPLLQGVFIGLFLAYIAYSVWLLRFYTLGALSVAIGLAIGLSNQTDSFGEALYFTIMGLAIMVSGGLTLLTYMGHTQPPGEAEA